MALLREPLRGFLSRCRGLRPCVGEGENGIHCHFSLPGESFIDLEASLQSQSDGSAWSGHDFSGLRLRAFPESGCPRPKPSWREKSWISLWNIFTRGLLGDDGATGLAPFLAPLATKLARTRRIPVSAQEGEGLSHAVLTTWAVGTQLVQQVMKELWRVQCLVCWPRRRASAENVYSKTSWIFSGSGRPQRTLLWPQEGSHMW